VPEMAQGFTYNEELTWWFTREEIGRGLRERYQVPKELPPKLLALVRKLAAVEGSSPRSRTLVGKLDAIEGKCLSRYAPPAGPRTVGPSDDWPLCT
jgi:hypothetical protein